MNQQLFPQMHARSRQTIQEPNLILNDLQRSFQFSNKSKPIDYRRILIMKNKQKQIEQDNVSLRRKLQRIVKNDTISEMKDKIMAEGDLRRANRRSFRPVTKHNSRYHISNDEMNTLSDCENDENIFQSTSNKMRYASISHSRNYNRFSLLAHSQKQLEKDKQIISIYQSLPMRYQKPNLQQNFVPKLQKTFDINYKVKEAIRKSANVSTDDLIFNEPQKGAHRLVLFKKTKIVESMQAFVIEISLVQNRLLICAFGTGTSTQDYKLLINKNKSKQIIKKLQGDYQKLWEKVIIKNDGSLKILWENYESDGQNALTHIEKLKLQEQRKYEIAQNFIERNYYTLLKKQLSPPNKQQKISNEKGQRKSTQKKQIFKQKRKSFAETPDHLSEKPSQDSKHSSLIMNRQILGIKRNTIRRLIERNVKQKQQVQTDQISKTIQSSIQLTPIYQQNIVNQNENLNRQKQSKSISLCPSQQKIQKSITSQNKNILEKESQSEMQEYGEDFQSSHEVKKDCLSDKTERIDQSIDDDQPEQNNERKQQLSEKNEENQYVEYENEQFGNQSQNISQVLLGTEKCSQNQDNQDNYEIEFDEASNSHYSGVVLPIIYEEKNKQSGPQTERKVVDNLVQEKQDSDFQKYYDEEFEN